MTISERKSILVFHVQSRSSSRVVTIVRGAAAVSGGGGAKGASCSLNAISTNFPIRLNPHFFQGCKGVRSSLKMFERGFGVLDRSKDVCVVLLFRL